MSRLQIIIDFTERYKLERRLPLICVALNGLGGRYRCVTLRHVPQATRFEACNSIRCEVSISLPATMTSAWKGTFVKGVACFQKGQHEQALDLFNEVSVASFYYEATSENISR